MKENAILWWQKGIVYQIYPRSFMDSDNDGVGDLNGIIEKLDYLKWLGIQSIWISPIFPSPMADFGYDVSDYTDIHPMFGTMDDFDRLLNEAHKRDLKVILDLVPNHTSDEHPWFKESRSSKDNPKRDWYIWKDPDPDGNPPNNWISEFGGSAWEYDDRTGQYYLHTFLKEQPDLNWYNIKVQEAIQDVLKFWFEKGVDGFRIDVIWYLIKDKLYRDNPPNPDWDPKMPDHDRLLPSFSSDQPDVHVMISKLREIADQYHEKLLIGELYLSIPSLMTYYAQGKGVHLPFNFHLLLTDWKAEEIYALIAQYEGAVPESGWPNWVMGNHDKPRLRSRIGKGQLGNAAILLLTLRGTPTIYYGEELGMDNTYIPKDRLQDPRAILEPEKGVGRDPQRTPMQWNSSEYAGFSNNEPWLPVDKDHKELNVETEKKDEHSLLNFYKNLIELRQNEEAFLVGHYIPNGINGSVISYIRKGADKSFLILLNFSEKPGELELKPHQKGKILICTQSSRTGKTLEGKISLFGNEGLVAELI